MRNALVLKIVAIFMFMVIGSTAMGFADPYASSTTHGHEKIEEIRDRSKSSSSMLVEDLISRSHRKNGVTQTSIEMKNVEISKNKGVLATEMIVADARYFNIYNTTGDDQKVIGQLKAYHKVKILKSVGDYYKIKDGFIKKKAVLTEKEYNHALYQH